MPGCRTSDACLPRILKPPSTLPPSPCAGTAWARWSARRRRCGTCRWAGGGEEGGRGAGCGGREEGARGAGGGRRRRRGVWVGGWVAGCGWVYRSLHSPTLPRAPHPKAPTQVPICGCSFSVQRYCFLLGLAQSQPPPPPNTHTHTHTHTHTQEDDEALRGAVERLRADVVSLQGNVQEAQVGLGGGVGGGAGGAVTLMRS